MQKNGAMVPELRNPVREVIDLLVRRDYSEVAALTYGRRLAEYEIQTAINDYGRRPIPPPQEAYDSLDIIPIVGREPPSYSVRMRLWTEEEGESDLSVELTVTRIEGDLQIELDDIHVF